MVQVPVNAQGAAISGGGSSATRALWRAVSSQTVTAPAVPDYVFGDLLVEVAGQWSVNDRLLTVAPLASDRVLEEDFALALDTAPTVWITRSDGSKFEAKQLSTTVNGVTAQRLISSGSVYVLRAGDVLSYEDARTFSLRSQVLWVSSDTTAVSLASVPGGIPVNATSAYIQVSGYVRMLSADSTLFPVVQNLLFGFYVFPNRDTLVNATFRLPTQIEYFADKVAQQVAASPNIPWAYSAPVGSEAAAVTQLTTTGSLSGLAQITITFSNQQQDSFRIISDVSQSMFDAMLVGEQSRDRRQGQTLSAKSFRPAQTLVVAGFTMPTIGQSISVSMAAIPGTTIDTAFQARDLVIAAHVNANGFTVGTAYFEIMSVSGSVVTMRALTRNDSVAPGYVFVSESASGRTEITGQTRLPSVPATAQYGIVTASTTDEIEAAAFNSSSPYYQMAQALIGGQALAYIAIKAGGEDIDFNSRYGNKLRDTGHQELYSAADLANARIVSRTCLAMAPVFEVIYK
jgi:hypothetical protein